MPPDVQGAAPRVGKGPRILTFSGAAVLLLGIAAGVVAVMLFLRAVPFDLLTLSGEPGPGALAATDVPGSMTVQLPSEPGVYGVWQAARESSGPDDTAGAAFAAGTAFAGRADVAATDDVDDELAGPRLTVDDIRVTDESGTPVAVGPAAISSEVGAGDVHGELVAQFEASGPVEIEVSDPGVADGTFVMIAEGQDFGSFFTTLFGTIGAWFLAVGGGMLGFFLLLGGIIWWALARDRAARSGPPPSPAP